MKNYSNKWYKKIFRPLLTVGMVATAPLIVACKKTNTVIINEILILESWNLNQNWSTTIESHNLFVTTLNQINTSVSTSSSTASFVKATQDFIAAAKKALSLSFPDPASENLMELVSFKRIGYSTIESGNDFTADYELQTVELTFRVKGVNLTKRLSWRVYKDGVALVNNLVVPPIAYITRQMHNNVVDALSSLRTSYNQDVGSTIATKSVYDLLKAQVFTNLQPIPEAVRLNLFKSEFPGLLSSAVTDENKTQVLKLNFSLGNDGYGARDFEFVWVVVEKTDELIETWSYQPTGMILSLGEHAMILSAISGMKNASNFLPIDTFYALMSSNVYTDMPPFPASTQLYVVEPAKLESQFVIVQDEYILKIELRLGSGSSILKKTIDFKWQVVSEINAALIQLSDESIDMSLERYEIFRSRYNSIIGSTNPTLSFATYSATENLQASRAFEIFKLMQEFGFVGIRLPTATRLITNLSPLTQVVGVTTGVSFNLQLSLNSHESNVANYYINVVVPVEGSFSWKNPLNKLMSITEHNKVVDIITEFRAKLGSPLNDFAQKLLPFFPDMITYSADIKIVSLVAISKITSLTSDQEVPVIFSGNVTTGIRIYPITLSWRVISNLAPNSINWTPPVKIRHTSNIHTQMVNEFNALSWNNAALGTIGALTNENNEARDTYLSSFYVFLVKYFRTVARFPSLVIPATKPIFVDSASSDRIRTYNITFSLIAKLATNASEAVSFTITWETVYADPSNPGGLIPNGMIFEVPRSRSIDLDTHNRVATAMNRLVSTSSTYLSDVQAILINNIYPEMLALPINSRINYKTTLPTYTSTTIPVVEINFNLDLQTPSNGILQLVFSWVVKKDAVEISQLWVSFYANLTVLYPDFSNFRTSLKAVIGLTNVSKVEKSNLINDVLRRNLNIDGVPLPPQIYISNVGLDAWFETTSGTFVTKLGLTLKRIDNDATITNPASSNGLFDIVINVSGTPAEVLNPVETAITNWIARNEYVSLEKHNNLAVELNYLLTEYGIANQQYAVKFWNAINEFLDNAIGQYVIGYKFTANNFATLTTYGVQTTPYARQLLTFSIQLGATIKNFTINYDIFFANAEGFFIPNKKKITYTMHLTILNQVKQIVSSASTPRKKLEDTIVVLSEKMFNNIRLDYPTNAVLISIANVTQLNALDYLSIKNKTIKFELQVSLNGANSVVAYEYEISVSANEGYNAWTSNNPGNTVIESTTYSSRFRGNWDGLASSTNATRTANTITQVNNYFGTNVMTNFLNWGLEVTATSASKVLRPGVSQNYQEDVTITYKFSDDANAATKNLVIKFNISFASLIEVQTNFQNNINSASSSAAPFVLNSYASYKNLLESLIPFHTTVNSNKIFEFLRTIPGLVLPDAAEWTIKTANSIGVQNMMIGVNVLYRYTHTLTYQFEMVANTSLKVNASIYVSANITEAEVLSLVKVPAHTAAPKKLAYSQASMLSSMLSGSGDTTKFYELINFIRENVLNETISTAAVAGATHDVNESRTSAFGPFFGMGSVSNVTPEFRLVTNPILPTDSSYVTDTSVAVVFNVILGSETKRVSIIITIAKISNSVNWTIPAANDSISILEWQAMQKELTELLALHQANLNNSYVTSSHSDRRIISVISYYGFLDKLGLSSFNTNLITKNLVMERVSNIAVLRHTVQVKNDPSDEREFIFRWPLVTNAFLAEYRLILKSTPFNISKAMYLTLKNSSQANFMTNLKATLHQHLENAFYELIPDWSSVKFIESINPATATEFTARVTFKSTSDSGLLFPINFNVTSSSYDPNQESLGLTYNRNISRKSWEKIKVVSDTLGSLVSGWINSWNQPIIFNGWEFSRLLITYLGIHALTPRWITSGVSSNNNYNFLIITKFHYVARGDFEGFLNIRLENTTSTSQNLGALTSLSLSGGLDRTPVLSFYSSWFETISTMLDEDAQDFGTGANQKTPTYLMGKEEKDNLVYSFKQIETKYKSLKFNVPQFMSRIEAFNLGQVTNYIAKYIEVTLDSVTSEDAYTHKIIWSITNEPLAIRKRFTFFLVDTSLNNSVEDNATKTIAFPDTSAGSYPTQAIGNISLSQAQLTSLVTQLRNAATSTTALTSHLSIINSHLSSSVAVELIGKGVTRTHVRTVVSESGQQKTITFEYKVNYARSSSVTLKSTVTYSIKFTSAGNISS